MFKEGTTKKVSMKFTNLSEEEKWLNNMLKNGWFLKKYSSEDVEECDYEFVPIENKEQEELIYRIDYRSFNKKSDYEEYKSIFEDTGWTIVSKNKWYSKHIFYAESKSNSDIFSDSDSFREREKRKMKSYLQYIIISIVFFIISVVLYNLYERSAYLAAGLFILFSAGKYLLDYYKMRKIYRSLE